MRARLVWGLVGAVVLAIFLMGQFAGGDDASVDPPDGWRSANAAGLGAWAAVLAHEDVELRVRDVDPGDLRLLPGTTYLFGEGLLTPRSARRVASEVRRGARVVATGEDARALLRALGRSGARLVDREGLALAARRTSETAATDRVERDGAVWPRAPRGLRPLLVLGTPSGDGPVVAGDLQVGRGRVVLIPARGIVDKAGIVRADNAAFAAGVVGDDRAVALRPREDASVGGLPPRAALVVLLLAAAAAALLVSRGRRLGPAVQPADDPTPGRSAYVDALAAVLARTSDRDAAAERLRARGRALLARRVGLAPDAGPDDVRAAARRAGLEDGDAAALAGTVTPVGPASAGADPGPASHHRGAGRHHDLQAVGRALARLEGDTR